MDRNTDRNPQENERNGEGVMSYSWYNGVCETLEIGKANGGKVTTKVGGVKGTRKVRGTGKERNGEERGKSKKQQLLAPLITTERVR